MGGDAIQVAKVGQLFRVAAEKAGDRPMLASSAGHSSALSRRVGYMLHG